MGAATMLAPLRRLGLRIPDEILNLLRFGRGVDNRLYKATGFDYGYTSREAVLDLAEHMRLEPVLQGHEQRYRYEREVEEFLRWSPHVRRERPEDEGVGTDRAARNLKGGLQRSSGFHGVCGPSFYMTRRWDASFQIAVAAVIVLMLGAAVGAYAWDNSRSDEIAEGITIGGVDVSGMTAAEARKVVDAELVEPRFWRHGRLRRGQVQAQPRAARVLGVDGMVDQRDRGEPGQPSGAGLPLCHRGRGRRRHLSSSATRTRP